MTESPRHPRHVPATDHNSRPCRRAVVLLLMLRSTRIRSPELSFRSTFSTAPKAHICIAQRFDGAMWELPDIQISQTTSNGPVSFHLDKAARTGFQLTGRRTSGASPSLTRVDDPKITPSPVLSMATLSVLDSSKQSIGPQWLHDKSSNALTSTFPVVTASKLPSIPRID
ncbi:hypothetical protein F5146DRAFT_1063966 [Armillaria mellea]|nr:hypothetical protein F5146DRAFT_1063966 [Armillaria mellea]